MKTWTAKKDSVERQWWVVDASEQKIGRLSTQIANILRGKNKPTFTPHVDTGDFVVVINASKLSLSGNKWSDKKYYRHSGFFGSLKEIAAKDLMKKDPTDILRKSVTGMLPKNRLAREQIKKLKIYAGSDHPHSAQKPESLSTIRQNG